MKSDRPFHRRHRFSPAERCGFWAFGAALVLGLIDLRLATVPLTLLVLLCALAPFMPRMGFFLPVISRGCSGNHQIALTFDDGPDPVTTPLLLDLLAAYRLPATFFVTGARARRYPHLVRAIRDQGHEIGNHSFSHNPLGMFWQPARLSQEVSATQQALAPLGIVPLAFRPPVGITTPAMKAVLDRQGLYALNYSCRALDGGNRRLHGLSATILKRLRADDIVLLHDLAPAGPQRLARWIDEVEKILQGLAARQLTAVALSDLIGRPVMHRITPCEK